MENNKRFMHISANEIRNNNCKIGWACVELNFQFVQKCVVHYYTTIVMHYVCTLV